MLRLMQICTKVSVALPDRKYDVFRRVGLHREKERGEIASGASALGVAAESASETFNVNTGANLAMYKPTVRYIYISESAL